MHDMPTVVGDNLHFDMAGLEKIPFEIDGIVAECGLRLRLRGLKRAAKILGLVHDARVAPTGRSFDDDGIADLAQLRGLPVTLSHHAWDVELGERRFPVFYLSPRERCVHEQQSHRWTRRLQRSGHSRRGNRSLDGWHPPR